MFRSVRVWCHFRCWFKANYPWGELHPKFYYWYSSWHFHQIEFNQRYSCADEYFKQSQKRYSQRQKALNVGKNSHWQKDMVFEGGKGTINWKRKDKAGQLVK